MVLPLLFAGLAKAGAAIAASSLTAPLLSLAGTAIGAAADNKARKTADYNNSPQGIRDRAEAAGFNPLLFVGPGTGTGAQWAPTMGHTIASGFAAAADQVTEVDRLRFQRQQLEAENERLTRQAERHRLQPVTPGIYGNRTREAPATGAPDAPRESTAYYTTMSGEPIAGPAPGTELGLDERLEWALRESIGATMMFGRTAARTYMQATGAAERAIIRAATVRPYKTNPRRVISAPETFLENFEFN